MEIPPSFQIISKCLLYVVVEVTRFTICLTGPHCKSKSYDRSIKTYCLHNFGIKCTPSPTNLHEIEEQNL